MSPTDEGTYTSATVQENGVMTIRFSRPDRRNVWSIGLENEYFARLDDAAQDLQVRAIVLTGSGRTFCPGVGTDQLSDEASTGTIELAGRRPMYTPRLSPKPIIAAINGACAGLGLVQALLCDVRFVAREARLTTAFARRGLPGEYNIAWLLTRLVGLERASDLLLTGRTFDGEEMHRMGLALRACNTESLLAEAEAYAAEIATWCSPTSLRTLRAQLCAAPDQSFEEAWADSLVFSEQFAALPDFAEGVRSFQQKRLPQFAPLSDPPLTG